MESENTNSTDLYSLLAWFEKNRKQIISAIVILILVGVIIAFVQWNREQKEITAGEALSAVTLTGNNSRPSADSLLKVADDNAGTVAAGRALLMAAGQLFADGNVENAQKQFQKFLADYEGSPLTPQAKLGVAACLEAQGKKAEAIAAFKEVADRFTEANTRSHAKFSMARLNEADGKLELARDQYIELMQEAQRESQRNSQSTFGPEAFGRLNDLMQKYPDLAKQSAPPTTTQVVPASVTPASK